MALKEKVDRLVKRDGSRCHYCKCELNFTDPQHPNYRTIDHKYSLSHGGTHRIGNLVLACQPCNLKKGNQGYKVFRRRRIR